MLMHASERSHVCGFFNGLCREYSRLHYTQLLEDHGTVIAIFFATEEGYCQGYGGWGYVQYADAASLRSALWGFREKGVRVGSKQLRMDVSDREFDLKRLLPEDCTQHRMPRISLLGSPEVMHSEAGGWALAPVEWENAGLE